jgi:hypothetical protein
VIVRISTEGQYDLPHASEPGLNELDNAAVAAAEANDEDAFSAAFGALLDYVRSHGSPVDGETLSGSDLILPPPDVSLEEARTEFTGEGLLPG